MSVLFELTITFSAGFIVGAFAVYFIAKHLIKKGLSNVKQSESLP